MCPSVVEWARYRKGLSKTWLCSFPLLKEEYGKVHLFTKFLNCKSGVPNLWLQTGTGSMASKQPGHIGGEWASEASSKHARDLGCAQNHSLPANPWKTISFQTWSLMPEKLWTAAVKGFSDRELIQVSIVLILTVLNHCKPPWVFLQTEKHGSIL